MSESTIWTLLCRLKLAVVGRVQLVRKDSTIQYFLTLKISLSVLQLFLPLFILEIIHTTKKEFKSQNILRGKFNVYCTFVTAYHLLYILNVLLLAIVNKRSYLRVSRKSLVCNSRHMTKSSFFLWQQKVKSSA